VEDRKIRVLVALQSGKSHLLPTLNFGSDLGDRRYLFVGPAHDEALVGVLVRRIDRYCDELLRTARENSNSVPQLTAALPLAEQIANGFPRISGRVF
jgi:hypothetical protein